MTFTHSSDISVKYGDLDQLVQWCDRNCDSQWSFTCDNPAGETDGDYKFYFNSEHDLINFTLWYK